MSIISLLRQQLTELSEMSFAEFMRQALYAPGLGYYSAGLQKFGRHGDFVTAPELTPLYGYSLANQCQPILSLLSTPVLFEFGAGSGRLCIDLLTHLERLDALPDYYLILEVSGTLKQRQQEAISTALPHLKHRVQWLSSWPQDAFNGVIIANEVLDAMPVHRFLQSSNGVLENYIRLDEHDRLVDFWRPSLNKDLLEYVKRVLPTLHQPYVSEVNLLMPAWMKQCFMMLNQGLFLIIDYGFPRHEYYHPERNQGTLMCHYQHQTHTNPLAHPGEEDITAHVDFTHVAEAAEAAGFMIAGYTNQAAFLLGNGLLTLLAEEQDPLQLLRQQQAVKQLLQASEMGELFKVMALTKALNLPLQGFELHDKRASL
ncbi:MAG: class I SAM-dependent methyltransferase [Legionella sp.]